MFGEIGSVLMLHQVAPYEEGKIIYNENLKISPDELNSIINQLKRDKRIFVSLDEMVHLLQEKKSQKRKFVALTLDDGYRDNLEYGFDVFKKNDVPFCIYVTNSFPNHTTNLWWFALEQLLLQNTHITIEGKQRDNRTASSRRANFIELRSAILEKYFRDPISYLHSLGSFHFDLMEERARLAMTWDEIASLSTEPLATIGCHTVNHFPLSRLSVAEAQYEIQASRKEIEQKIQKKVKHFAFPFGSKNEVADRDIVLADNEGFDTVVTTDHGHIHLGDKSSQLKRIFVFSLKNNKTTLRRLMYLNVKSFLYLTKKAISVK